jgi:hypothetical protein
MKLTKEMLKRIIKEELEATLKEMDRNDDFKPAVVNALEAMKKAGVKDENQIALAIVQQMDKEGVTSKISDMDSMEIAELASRVLGTPTSDLEDLVKLYSNNPSLIGAASAAMAAKKAGVKEPQKIAQAIMAKSNGDDFLTIIDHLQHVLALSLGDEALAKSVAEIIEG